MELLPLKDIAAVIGMLAAGLFFYYKVMSGGQSVNMSLSIAPERTDLNETQDQLVMTLVLNKGEHGSLTIYDMQARITSQEKEPIIAKFVGLGRQDWDASKKIQWAKLREGKGYTDNPNIRITPGEILQFVSVSEVPSGATCVIEVAILGQRDFSPFVSQWKSSSVCLPISRNA